MKRCRPWALALVGVLAAVSTFAQRPASDTRRSGFEAMSPATQALQNDDTQNPAWLWLKAGEERFASDCTGCHAAEKMDGAAARYPAWDTALGKPLTLAGRINQCRARNARAAPYPAESEALLGLETFIGQRSRGRPIVPPDDARLAPWRERGRELFGRRIGQLGLACADCHDANAGGRLAGSPIPQGHPTGYPIYRLEWQGVGSLQRRLRNCMAGVRAEPFAYGADEMTMLELYLMQRAAGMTLETPGVRP